MEGHKRGETNSDKQESLVCLTACLIIAAPSIISLFNKIVRLFIVVPYKLDTVFIYGVILIIVAYSIKIILKRSITSVYLVICFLLIAYLVGFLINWEYKQYYTSIGYNLIFESVPWLIVAFAVRDFKLFKKYLYFSGIIVMISFIMNFLVFGIEMTEMGSYSQQYTYLLLPSAIIIADAIYENKRLIDIVLFIITIFFMFSMGARGPIACVVIFLILKSLLSIKLNPQKALGRIIPSVLLLAALIVFFNDLMEYLLIIIEKMNLSTRTVTRLIQGTFFEDNARNLLTEYSFNLIKKHPFTGVGVGSDRILLAAKMGYRNLASEAIGWYPHNIFLELLLHFGVFVGGAIIIYMIYIIYISIFKNTNKEMTDTICIFTSIGFFPLLFSGSYLNWPLFFALLGFCLSASVKIKEHNTILCL